MKIKQYKGTDDFIYQNLGRFSMDRSVIRAFKGYPLLTSENHTWFVALAGDDIVGFAAVEILKNNNTAIFMNDYTLPPFRKKGIHGKLIRKRLAFVKKTKVEMATADCTKSCIKQYTKEGFKIIKEFVQWTKVEINL